MSRAQRVSETPATRLLRSRAAQFSEHPYPYVEPGGTAQSARALGVDEYQVIKTLIMEDESGRPFVVLMHGTHRVLTKELARALGCKRVAPCSPEVAQRHSGYLVGGTAPFATKRPLHVYVERSILALSRIYLNGGRRGYLIGIDPAILPELIQMTPVDCAALD